MARFQGTSSSGSYQPSELSLSHQIKYTMDDIAEMVDDKGKVQRQGAILCLDGLELLPRSVNGAVWKIYVTRLADNGSYQVREMGFFWLDANEEKSSAVLDRNDELKAIQQAIDEGEVPQHGMIVQKSAFKNDKGAVRHFIRLISVEEPFTCGCGQKF